MDRMEDRNQNDQNNELELIKDLINQRRKMTMVYYKWLSTPREYFPGDLLYMREAHIIIEIGPHGVENVSELGERLGVTQGAISQQLGKLEKKGYLIRIQAQNDRRQFSVELTEKGKRLYELHQELDRKQYDIVKSFFRDFTGEELEVIKRFDKRFEELFS